MREPKFCSSGGSARSVDVWTIPTCSPTSIGERRRSSQNFGGADRQVRPRMALPGSVSGVEVRATNLAAEWRLRQSSYDTTEANSFARMKFELRESALLRLTLGPVRFDPWEFFNEGAYQAHRAEKDEVEAFVREYVAGIDLPGLEAAVRLHAEYLREWVPGRVKAAQSDADYARLCAFAELHHAIGDAEHELTLASLRAPDRGDLVFDEHPELYDAMTDGLMRLTPTHIEEPWVAENAAFFLGESALFPHPFLAEYRELLGALADLASDPVLTVYVAIDPQRVGQRDQLQQCLLADYWDGLQLTPQTLDSLDRHDQGSSFHAAIGRSEVEELFHPLLGTWFHWRARADDKSDPVKRGGGGRECLDLRVLDVRGTELHAAVEVVPVHGVVVESAYVGAPGQPEQAVEECVRDRAAADYIDGAEVHRLGCEVPEQLD